MIRNYFAAILIIHWLLLFDALLISHASMHQNDNNHQSDGGALGHQLMNNKHDGDDLPTSSSQILHHYHDKYVPGYLHTEPRLDPNHIASLSAHHAQPEVISHHPIPQPEVITHHPMPEPQVISHHPIPQPEVISHHSMPYPKLTAPHELRYDPTRLSIHGYEHDKIPHAEPYHHSMEPLISSHGYPKSSSDYHFDPFYGHRKPGDGFGPGGHFSLMPQQEIKYYPVPEPVPVYKPVPVEKPYPVPVDKPYPVQIDRPVPEPYVAKVIQPVVHKQTIIKSLVTHKTYDIPYKKA